MSYSTTPAEERAVDALSLLDSEQILFRDEVGREALVYLVRHVLDAAVTTDVVAQELARKHVGYLWDDAHRDDLLKINPDAAQVDRILTEHRDGMVSQFTTTVQIVREALLGEHA